MLPPSSPRLIPFLRANYIYNQRLMSYVRFLGELYNYSMIEHPLIFDTLHYFIGLSQGVMSDRPDPADPPTDLFRIRLVRTLSPINIFHSLAWMI